MEDSFDSCVRGGGQARILRVFAPFDLLGISEVLMGQTVYTAAAKAARETQAIFISKIDLLDAEAQDPAVRKTLLYFVAREALAYQQGLIRALQPGVKERLIETLRELASLHGRSIPEGRLIELAITNTELAEMVGCTVESISHVICELRQRGWLLRVKGQLVLQNIKLWDESQPLIKTSH